MLFAIQKTINSSNQCLDYLRIKTEVEKLNEKYDKLMKESFELSKINRKASDEKYAEANEIMKKIEKLTS
jgi:predicted nuclease with TOPRIM domain